MDVFLLTAKRMFNVGFQAEVIAEKQNTAYVYDAASQLIATFYPNDWNTTYAYDLAGQLLRQYAEAPSKKANDSIEHKYTYDPQGNILTEFRSGAGGQSRYNLKHTYDALNRMLTTTGDQGYKAQTYTYDSLGNLTYELIHNKGTEYKYNNLNQQIQRIEDGKDTYSFTFDKRGNLIRGVFAKDNSIISQYTYDAANRMAKGVNRDGEESHYIYNGLGSLVANEWIVANNAYGYHGFAYTPSEQVDGVVVTCTAHDNTTGQGHINPTGAGHFKDKGETNNGSRTTGGTEGGVLPKGSNKVMSIHKDYVIDYTSPLQNVIMEYEDGSGGLTYRYVYGLQKLEAVIYNIPNGVGSVAQSYDYPSGKASVVKLYYHQDRLMSTDYLTDNISGKVTSYTEYDPWGALLMKTIVKLSTRELDLVTQYTVHPYDQVLGVYFAQARMYDAAGRRFLAVDLYPPNMVNTQSWSRYIYVVNNPLVYVDLTGLNPVKVEGAEITVGTGGAIVNVYVDISSTVYVDFYEALGAYGLTAKPVTPGSGVGSVSNDIIVGYSNGAYIYQTFETMHYVAIGGQIETRISNRDFVSGANRTVSHYVTSYYRNDGKVLVDFEYFKQLMCDMRRNRAVSYNAVLVEYLASTKGVFPVKGLSSEAYNSAYGDRIHPIRKVVVFHEGIDIPAPGGRELLAMYDGVVVSSKWNGAKGYYIEIQTKGKINGKIISYSYSHMQIPSELEKGDEVKAGDTVGYVGTTGTDKNGNATSTGNHLHIEVYVDGTHKNPDPNFINEMKNGKNNTSHISGRPHFSYIPNAA